MRYVLGYVGICIACTSSVFALTAQDVSLIEWLPKMPWPHRICRELLRFQYRATPHPCPRSSHRISLHLYFQLPKRKLLTSSPLIFHSLRFFPPLLTPDHDPSFFVPPKPVRRGFAPPFPLRSALHFSLVHCASVYLAFSRVILHPSNITVFGLLVDFSMFFFLFLLSVYLIRLPFTSASPTRSLAFCFLLGFVILD